MGTDEINIVRVSAPGGVSDSLDAALAAAPRPGVVGYGVDLAMPLEVTSGEGPRVERPGDTSFIRFSSSA